MKQTFLKLIILSSILVISFWLINVAFAEGYKAIAPIPGLTENGAYPTDLSVLINNLYNWGIGLVGVLAFVMMTYGGILYMISGAVDQKSKAKGIITDALIGLALALSSFIILNIINPNLVDISHPSLEKPPAATKTKSEPTIWACLTAEEIVTKTDEGYACAYSSDPSEISICSTTPSTVSVNCVK